ncbi:transport permease protein [Microbispora rosea subsp. aerata]|nr:ABC transporter permease [Microbispora rosea]GGO00698.1 transport permease protein [Microbispora rosea subsp. aerata]GIH56860.1 transport permease protein [Microbispora rosea subsp. aerata]GLJ84345.1 transport permease protein [Microbispora rosea subsp. aerata]
MTTTLTSRALRLGIERARLELRAVTRDVNRLFIEFHIVNIALFVLLALLLGDRTPSVPGGVSQVAALTVTFMLISIAQLGVVSVAQAVIVSRDDGTLLRLRCTPGGLRVFVTEKIAYVVTIGVVVLGALTVSGVALTDLPLPASPGRWATLFAVAALGLATTAVIGALLGAVLPDARESLGYSVLPIFLLVLISGMNPAERLPDWVNRVLDVLPFNWMARGLRSALMPDAMAALETAGSWQRPLAFAVLAGWAAAGALVTVPLLRRMTLQASGSDLARRRERAEARYR